MSGPDDNKLYDVRWRRPNQPEELECHNLTAELLVFRIRGVIRLCGSVELLAVSPVKAGQLEQQVNQQ